jgi:hypothetical protein
VDISTYPRLQQFLTQMRELPAVQNALAIETQNLSALQDSHFTGYFEFA